ncbi:MAG: hypothetical protein MK095_04200 [Phycisphaerales bacterium]|nr:hypothetical protein [Phycisphaerales bacterium]
MTLLIIMLVAGGIITWVAGPGLELILAGGITTSLQFRFFVGIAAAFAIGGGSHLKDTGGIVPNHGGWIAVFALPGVVFAAPIYLLPADWSGLTIVAIIWGVLAGGCGYVLSRMFNLQSG